MGILYVASTPSQAQRRSPHRDKAAGLTRSPLPGDSMRQRFCAAASRRGPRWRGILRKYEVTALVLSLKSR